MILAEWIVEALKNTFFGMLKRSSPLWVGLLARPMLTLKSRQEDLNTSDCQYIDSLLAGPLLSVPRNVFNLLIYSTIQKSWNPISNNGHRTAASCRLDNNEIFSTNSSLRLSSFLFWGLSSQWMIRQPTGITFSAQQTHRIKSAVSIRTILMTSVSMERLGLLVIYWINWCL